MQHVEIKSVKAPDGIKTMMRSKGPQDAPGIVLIHGILHCSLVWKYQYADPTLSGVRLVSYDIRGHGAADKPEDAASYQPERFADELDSVIKASGVERPILLGWSLGTRMIFNYLEQHGAGRIGGFAIVGARSKQDPALQSAAMRSAMQRNCDDDFQTRLDARRDFTRACHEVPPSLNDFIDLVACSMLVPPGALRHFAALDPRSGFPRSAGCRLPAERSETGSANQSCRRDACL
jgi:pimeloyl-ACP methyl ester carboxylesterase